MDEIDKQIFTGSGSENPFNAKDEIYVLLEKHIEAVILGMDDRCYVMHVEAAVAMLYRLSSYFDNVITRKTDAMLWKHQVLVFFDSETKSRDDADQVKDWRNQIESNFDRLIDVLNI